MCRYGITQSRHCNNDNDDNMMHASVWFKFFWQVILMSKTMIYEKEMWQQRGRFKLSTYVSLGIGDIREGGTQGSDITEVTRVYSVGHTKSDV